ncbi:hypothetical protein BCR37DRAFT_413004 [Protomyces lactucae-debilis]|uniref:Uncharacterized protein n=1 Tax=Protomyces lactucae-debilis TaxID=2754530 RepID=A0A1Y2FIE9_PROLT|nr:uncharacterized protein BCR37DRAFT_413004 [Protomyces lactucae-debilis]ORY83721.1 hypothetical protein BCR37DRAFT_413004 [Protomyces lactucae-debilis]
MWKADLLLSSLSLCLWLFLKLGAAEQSTAVNSNLDSDNWQWVDKGLCYSLEFQLFKVTALPEQLPCHVYCFSEAIIFQTWFQAMRQLYTSRLFVCSVGWESLHWAWTTDPKSQARASSSKTDYEDSEPDSESFDTISGNQLSKRGSKSDGAKCALEIMQTLIYNRLLLHVADLVTLSAEVLQLTRRHPSYIGRGCAPAYRMNAANSTTCILPVDATASKTERLIEPNLSFCKCSLALNFDRILQMGHFGYQYQDKIQSMCLAESFAHDIANLPRGWSLDKVHGTWGHAADLVASTHRTGFVCKPETLMYRSPTDQCSGLHPEEEGWSELLCQESLKLMLATQAAEKDAELDNSKRKNGYPDSSDSCRGPKKPRTFL